MNEAILKSGFTQPASYSMESTDLSLSREAGHMSFQPRLVQLRQFASASSLTGEELRYVKLLLSRVHIDIIGELPIELLRQIAGFLDLHHFAACLAVSRRWRNKFLSASVIRAVLDKFCSSLGQVDSSTQISPGECLEALHRIGRLRWKCFQSSLTKEYTWKEESYFRPDPDYHGNYEDISTVYAQFSRQDQDPRPNRGAYKTAMYSNGKIAWRAKPHVVVVDDLWLRTRKIFDVPTGLLVGPTIQLLALGNRLVVGAVDRLLVVWDHVTNTRLEKNLPGSIKHATTQGCRVAMVIFSGDVLLWEFGGKLSTLATAPLIKTHSSDAESLKSWVSNLVVIFHPGCSETLFLASCYTYHVNSKAIFKQEIFEFKGSNRINTFKNEISPKFHNDSGRGIAAVPEIQKLLPYRRDIIGFRLNYVPSPPLLAQPSAPFPETIAVEFDIYDRKFSSLTGLDFDYLIPGWPEPDEECDLDFAVKFQRGPCLTVRSLRPGFDFNSPTESEHGQ
ncbi:hypothetical protein F5Y05DRAFT_337381 [Hypoxylon sp. FL0543]|nr:hypothetical protein F5Y05DRAFT_337381 [Hypoxylon sp. FL0543]